MRRSLLPVLRPEIARHCRSTMLRVERPHHPCETHHCFCPFVRSRSSLRESWTENIGNYYRNDLTTHTAQPPTSRLSLQRIFISLSQSHLACHQDRLSRSPESSRVHAAVYRAGRDAAPPHPYHLLLHSSHHYIAQAPTGRRPLPIRGAISARHRYTISAPRAPSQHQGT